MSPASDQKGGPVRLAAGGHGLSAGGVFTLSLSLTCGRIERGHAVPGPWTTCLISRSRRWAVFLRRRLSRNAAGAGPDSPGASSGSRIISRIISRITGDRHPDRPGAPGAAAAPGCQNPPAHPARNPPDDPWAPARTHHRKLPCLYGQCDGQDRETGGLPGECGPRTADTSGIARRVDIAGFRQRRGFGFFRKCCRRIAMNLPGKAVRKVKGKHAPGANRKRLRGIPAYCLETQHRETRVSPRACLREY